MLVIGYALGLISGFLTLHINSGICYEVVRHDQLLLILTIGGGGCGGTTTVAAATTTTTTRCISFRSIRNIGHI
jgi:hypothetical protein